MGKWTVDNIPDQSGKTIIITGANSGLGFESSVVLAERGARIVMACRNLKKGLDAKTRIIASIPDAVIDLQPLDLSGLESVRSFSDYIHKTYDQVHVLMNNAGIMATPYALSSDGYEMQFAVNHLGHFALTGLVLDILLKTSGSRVVNVSSIAARRGKINFGDLMSQRSYVPWYAYGQSKLANQLFTYELQRKLESSGSKTISLCAHPGVTLTNLHKASSMPLIIKTLGVFLFSPFMTKASKGALPQLMAATDPNVSPGGYYGPDGFREMNGNPAEAYIPPQAKQIDTAEKLWTVSEELTGVNYKF